MSEQSILITGGTGKFGRIFVAHFFKKGWQVLFTTTSKERGDSLIASLSGNLNIYTANNSESTANNKVVNDRLIALVVDLTEDNVAPKLVETIENKGYKVNHLVTNARSLDFLQTDDNGQAKRDDFMAEYLMDVVVPYELSMALFNTQADALRTITNIGSQYGVVAANPQLYDDPLKSSPIQYGVAKAALMHLTKELAVRLADSNVRVNCVAYGGVEGRVDDAFKARYAKLTPSRRMLAENDIIGPLDLLISASARAINGQTIQADDGWTLW